MLMSFNDYEMNVSSTAGGGAEATNTRFVGPQVFVINLDSAQDRLAQFSGRLDKFGVPFTRWRATSGDELDASSFGIRPTADGIYISGFREWSKNEAACGVSHVRLLQHIVRQGLPWAIVMEDDAVLLDRLPATLSEWKLPPDADIVLLNDRVTTGPVSHGDKPYAYGRVTGGAGTDGYLISLAGAHALLHVLNPLRDPLDFQMYAHFVSIQEHDKAPFIGSFRKIQPRGTFSSMLMVWYRRSWGIPTHPRRLAGSVTPEHGTIVRYCSDLTFQTFIPTRRSSRRQKPR